MANYPALSPHLYMPAGAWQANPWDTNPPLGTTPNLVYPQNTTPYQINGGSAPWAHQNPTSLYPQHIVPHAQPCHPYYGQNAYQQPPYTPSTPSQQYPHPPSLNNAEAECTPCPCCGNITTNNNISAYQKRLEKHRHKHHHTRAESKSMSDKTSHTQPLSKTSSSISQRTVKNTVHHNNHARHSGASCTQGCPPDLYSQYMRSYWESVSQTQPYQGVPGQVSYSMPTNGTCHSSFATPSYDYHLSHPAGAGPPIVPPLPVHMYGGSAYQQTQDQVNENDYIQSIKNSYPHKQYSGGNAGRDQPRIEQDYHSKFTSSMSSGSEFGP